MKIFLVIPTLSQGGAERVISLLANQFISIRDVKVHLVLLAGGDLFYKINNNIIVHKLQFVNKNKFRKSYSIILTFFKLRRLVKDQNPDVILSFLERFNSFTILATLFLKRRVFVSDRSSPLKKLSFFNEVLRRITYKYSSGIISQTKYSQEVLFIKTKNKNIKVIPNPVREIISYSGVEKEKIIINIGRLVPEKGQEFLIDCFSRIQNKEWKLKILGDGPLMLKLKRKVKEIGIEERVEFLGNQNNVDFWLARASIFVLTSISEGFPNALLESMCAGLPCISFDCYCGPRDIIKNGENGILIQEKNIKELVAKLDEMISDPDLRARLSKEASKVKNIYNLNVISQQYFEFITS
ncbi:MAG: glycosyltransferase family 4 protein [Saprospiraceae bacterium]|nr:glycosyltransferase family 4 protein [Saprospiraceae bacterium]